MDTNNIGKVWSFGWFDEKDNYEDIIEGKKLMLTAKVRAKLWIEHTKNSPRSYIKVKSSYITTTDEGIIRAVIEGEYK